MPYTACRHRMAHRKWKETKQLPSLLPGPAVPGCSLISFLFLWTILCPQAVSYNLLLSMAINGIISSIYRIQFNAPYHNISFGSRIPSFHSKLSTNNFAKYARCLHASQIVYDRKGFLPFGRNRKATKRKVPLTAGTGITAGTPKGAKRG